MSLDEHVNWLMREVRDLLDAGRVGLYELPQILEGGSVVLGPAARTAVAKKVVEALLNDRSARLVLLKWPDFTPIEDLDLEHLGGDVWRLPGGEGEYAALMPEDGS